MADLTKFMRLLQLISALRRPSGADKLRFCRQHDLSPRTFDRHIAMLREAGFSIQSHQGKYKVHSAQHFHVEDYLHFTLEETEVIREAMEHMNSDHPLGKSIWDKLYLMADLYGPAEQFHYLSFPGKVRCIREAMESGKRVILKKYWGAEHDKPEDREIEPVALLQYHQYVEAYDVDRQDMRMFRLSRAESVQSSKKKQTHQAHHKARKTDPFLRTGPAFQVVLKLSPRARNLLLDEVEISPDQLTQLSNGWWQFTGEMRGLEGIGRFILGLPKEIDIQAPEALKSYVKQQWTLATEPHEHTPSTPPQSPI
jgi:predicted DNA-binding transcriptional regulator YafY